MMLMIVLVVFHVSLDVLKIINKSEAVFAADCDCAVSLEVWGLAVQKKRIYECDTWMHIKIYKGDTVTVELTTYDLTKGRIIFRGS